MSYTHARTHTPTHTHRHTHIYTTTHAHTPQDGHQLLQAVEDVHFQLFIALVLHLAAVTLAIHRIVKLQRSLHTFESTLRRRRSAARVQRARGMRWCRFTCRPRHIRGTESGR